MRIEISDGQRVRRARREAVRRLAAFLLRRVRPPASASEWAGVTVVLLDDAGMREVHGRTLGQADATDVISCRYAPLPGEPGPSADVFVNVERAAAEGGRRRGWTPEREFGLYLAHGLDHLSGADDATAAQRGRMRRRELRWLRAAEGERLLADVFRAPARKRTRGSRGT